MKPEIDAEFIELLSKLTPEQIQIIKEKIRELLKLQRNTNY